MMPNDNSVYLAFVKIENMLDNFNIEYQSFNNRIEFFINNQNQVIIDSSENQISLFSMNNYHIFSLKSDNIWLSQTSDIDLFQFIEQLVRL
ncbi:MAG: hypothetical protein VYE31_02830 [Pseudomonadota bacterium]|nr:hypothetical protein [Pseudomonadota bacterium]